MYIQTYLVSADASFQAVFIFILFFFFCVFSGSDLSVCIYQERIAPISPVFVTLSVLLFVLLFVLIFVFFCYFLGVVCFYHRLYHYWYLTSDQAS